jgi:hypothetical protein
VQLRLERDEPGAGLHEQVDLVALCGPPEPGLASRIEAPVGRDAASWEAFQRPPLTWASMVQSFRICEAETSIPRAGRSRSMKARV